MIYVMLLLLSAAFLAPCVPALFSHEYQEIGDDVTLCTFYSFFLLPLSVWMASRAMSSGWGGM